MSPLTRKRPRPSTVSLRTYWLPTSFRSISSRSCSSPTSRTSTRSRHSSGEVYAKLDNLAIWPATEYVTSTPTIERALDEIRHELEEQVARFEAEGRLLEAHRLRQRTEYDLGRLTGV